MRYICFSSVLHALIISLFFIYYTPSVFKTEAIAIEIKPVKTKVVPILTKSAPKGTTIVPIRLSNTGPNSLELSEQLTASNYLDRVRGLIEPSWRRQAATRLNNLRRAKRSIPKCTTCLEVYIDPQGDIAKTDLLQSCNNDLELDKAAIDSFNRRLIPVPSNLLRANSLILTWCFEIK